MCDVSRIAQMKQNFIDLDILNQGKLERKIVAQILVSQGQAIESLMVGLLFEKYDTNGDGYIDFDEFVRFCDDMEKLSEKEILAEIFKLIDKDGNGVLDVEELKQFGLSMGFDVTLSDAWATIRELDRNDDDQIDFDEFCAIINC